MNIWIFQTGEPLPSDEGSPRPMRAMNLANELVKKGHRVVLWSAGFSHQAKAHRCREFLNIDVSKNLAVRLIPSPGYKQNISVARFYDHFVLARNLRKQLKSTKEIPDIAFVGYPPIEAAYVMIKWLRKKNIPSLLDIKDQWPVIFVNIAPGPLRFFAKFLLSPYYNIAKKLMQNANGICAHTSCFVQWSLNFANRSSSRNDIVVPLTSPNDNIESNVMAEATNWWAKRGVNNDGTFRIMFVGSFSRAFDFDEIFLAAEQLLDRKINCEFILCGDGEKNSELRSKAKHFNSVKIIEWIDRPKIRALAKISNAMVAPNKNTDDFAISIPNKIIDSLMLGLPIFSPLKGEVSSLIKDYNIGFSYGRKFHLSDCIISLITDKKSRKKMSQNALALYESKFEFNKVYSDLVLHLESIVKHEQAY